MEASIKDTTAKMDADKTEYEALTATFPPTSIKKAHKDAVSDLHSGKVHTYLKGVYAGKSVTDMMIDSVWGSGNAAYFVNKHKHVDHPAYATKLRSSVTDEELTALSDLGKKYPDLNQFMLE